MRPESGQPSTLQAQLAFELDAMRRLHELTLRLDRTADLPALLVEVLDAIVALHRADFGAIRLFDPSQETLRLVAQKGFDAAFESGFAEVGALDGTSCGQALARGERVVVEDVETDPGFARFREAARCYGFSAAQSTPLFGADGEPLGMVSTYFRERRPFSDSDHRLTDLYARQASEAIVRHRREDALRASQTRLQRMIETESVGITFFSPDGTLLDANEAFLRMVGWRREDAVGRLHWRALTPSEWVSRTEAEMARLPTEGRVGPYEMPYVTRDGARRWMLFTGHDLGDGTNVGYALDITERKRAGDAQRESEARFRGFGEASSDVLWIRDAKSLRWEYLSAASKSVYGLDLEHALAGDTLRVWLDLILPEDRDLAVEKLRSVARGERVMLEYRVKRASDGRIRWLRETMFPLAVGRGRVKRIGGIGEDITDEKETADRLTVLVGELQHRTRNLMAVVRSIAQRTARGSRSLQDFKAKFGARMDALARVQALLSRLQEGDRVPFDELVEDELRSHQGSHLTLDGPTGVLLRSSTVQILAMAIHELATNAMKYGALAQPKGRLAVRWRLEPAEPNERRRLRVEWIESGVAMPPESETHGGAGRELIERALPYQLDAETNYTLGEDGVRCVISLPVSEHTPRE